MGKISLLDCTLRDGGYLNDWRFGKEAILDTIGLLEKTAVEIIEVGFIRKEKYCEDRVVFDSMSRVKEVIREKKKGVLYSVMGELLNPISLENIEPADKSGIDVIRMILWKSKKLPNGEVVDALEEGYEYCKGLVEKGYKLCIQPVRVNQYSDEEFVAMIKRFESLNPLAIYVVDSWGTDNPEDLLHYMRLADLNMNAKTTLGYHGHNNMMHALAVAQEMLRTRFDRDIIIDASVYGIGRGAGNLNLEIIAKYLNEQYRKKYDLYPMITIYDRYISEIFEKEKWGYSIPFLITSMYKANPRITRYMVDELGLNNAQIKVVLDHLTDEQRIIFSKATIDDCVKIYINN